MKTAVQKLEQQLKDVLGDMFIDFALEQEFEQAKQMEKQQIIDAYANGSNDRLKNIVKDYFDETYGSNGSDETKTN